MLHSRLLKSLAASCLIAISACSHKFEVPDTEFCWDAGELGATCFNSNDVSQERDIPKEEWDTVRFGWACISEEDVGELKLFIENVCAKTRCTKEFKKKFRSFFKKYDDTIRPRLDGAARGEDWR
jgi:hypothetical protein